MPVQRITKERVVAFQKELAAGRSPTRVNNVVNLLRTVLNYCVESGHLSESPVAKLKRLREEDPDIDPLTLEELYSVFASMDAHYVPIFKVLAWTGMRPNEVKALLWSDIDWQRGEIKISKGIYRKTEATTTKTKSSKRIIPMHPEVRSALDEMKDRKLKNAKGLIFVSKKGDTLSHHLDDVWRRALKKAGLRHRPSYQLRHTWASMALAAGEDPMWVSKMLGHSNVAITFKHYARFIPSDKHGKLIGQILVVTRPHEGDLAAQ